MGFSSEAHNFYKPLSIKCLQGFFVHYSDFKRQLKIEVLIAFYFINNKWLRALPPPYFIIKNQDARSLGPSRGV